MQVSATVEFKSSHEFYYKERSGIKNNTVRVVDKVEDEKLLAILDDIKYIRIVKYVCVLDEKVPIRSSYFIRTITDISRWVNPIDLRIIYIFTWEA